MKRFFVVALPRSRTAWLSNLLWYGDSTCLHEPMIRMGCRSVADLRDRLEAYRTSVVGVIDTGLPMLIDDALEVFPDARYVVLTGNEAHYRDWCARLGQTDDEVDAVVGLYDHAVTTLGRRALHVPVSALDDFDTVAMLWGYLGIPTPFNRARFDALVDMDVQHMFARIARDMQTNAAAVLELLGG
jgi:hypothetical protein